MTWGREIALGLLAIVLLSAATVVTGDAEFTTGTVLVVLLKLSLLLAWVFIAGRILDAANKDEFHADKKRIDDGNVAVALSRTGGFAVLVIAGAILLAQI